MDQRAERVVHVAELDDEVLVPRREALRVRARVHDERALDAVGVLRVNWCASASVSMGIGKRSIRTVCGERRAARASAASADSRLDTHGH